MDKVLLFTKMIWIDMKALNKYYFLCFFLLMSACQPKIVPQPMDFKLTGGQVMRLTDFPSEHVSSRNIDIWLPADYDEQKAYQVLYMHDGQMLYDSTTTWNGQEWGVDEVMSSLRSEEKVPPTIVVGIWNANKERHADYFPQKPFESLSSDYQKWLLEESTLFVHDVSSDAYLRFIVEELKPYIDTHYATLPDQAHTFIAGSSMGGLISMYALCEYPEVFSAAACLSTHWIGVFDDSRADIPQSFLAYLKDHLPDPASHKLYFDFGTETLDAYYEKYQLQVDQVMRDKGYTSDSWQTMKFEGAAHAEADWKQRLHIPLQFILSD